MTDAGYTDDLVLLTNSCAETECLLYRLEQWAGGIGLYGNTNKTEFQSFKQGVAISTISGKPLKLVDKFIYLGSNISSTERDLNICIAKVQIAINWLSIIWKSDTSGKIKWDFLQAVLVQLYGCTTWTWMKPLEKEPWEQYKNVICYFEQNP